MVGGADVPDGRRVIVDADACPKRALQILQRLAKQYHFQLITVASFHHEIDNAHHVMVGDAPDEADLAIINRVRPGDIVVTQDWGLAALVLSKEGQAISPLGWEYTGERIDFMLDERHIKAKVRRGGGRTKGPRARTPNDDVAFEAAMRRLLGI